MHQVLFGTALLTSFLGGVVALLAPCCVSVMLPAYFATGFSRRTGIAAATGAFAAGVATLIVPVGLGASAISAALPAHHLLIFSIGGGLMLAGWVEAGAADAVAALAVRTWLRRRLRAGAVLRNRVGVLRAGAGRGGGADRVGGVVRRGAGVSLTYVAGMVAPLAVLALVWEGRD